METIVAAAVQIDGITHSMPKPARHHTIIHALRADYAERKVGLEVQGFLTSGGRFVGRDEAARIAVRAEQIDLPQWGDRLFSEDLW